MESLGLYDWHALVRDTARLSRIAQTHDCALTAAGSLWSLGGLGGAVLWTSGQYYDSTSTIIISRVHRYLRLVKFVQSRRVARLHKLPCTNARLCSVQLLAHCGVCGLKGWAVLWAS
eukprot:2582340-Prymnesium_polylepis.1